MPEMSKCVFTRIWLLAVVFNLAGCWFAKESDIPGKYTVTQNWGTGHLELRAGGTYIEEVSTKEGLRKTVEGKWKFTDDRRRLIRSPCLNIDHKGVHELVDYCDQSVNRSIGHIQIELEPDFGLAYLK